MPPALSVWGAACVCCALSSARNVRAPSASAHPELRLRRRTLVRCRPRRARSGEPPLEDERRDLGSEVIAPRHGVVSFRFHALVEIGHRASLLNVCAVDRCRRQRFHVGRSSMCRATAQRWQVHGTRVEVFGSAPSAWRSLAQVRRAMCRLHQLGPVLAEPCNAQFVSLNDACLHTSCFNQDSKQRRSNVGRGDGGRADEGQGRDRRGL
jgi:hypothetical protein